MDEIVVCKSCGNAAEEGYVMPLCAECRDAYSKRELPTWLKCMGAIVIIIFVIALVRFPKALNLGISYEKGVKAEQNGNYSEAEKDYKEALDVYPDSDKLIARYGISAYKNGDILAAVVSFKKLDGKEIDKDLVNEINPIVESINDKLEKIKLEKK